MIGMGRAQQARRATHRGQRWGKRVTLTSPAQAVAVVSIRIVERKLLLVRQSMPTRVVLKMWLVRATLQSVRREQRAQLTAVQA
jgi:hypothetical protein